MRVNGDEGTPVPIPNTVVKLIYGDHTWLAAAREDNSTRTRNTDPLGSVFCFCEENALTIYAVLISVYNRYNGISLKYGG